MENCIIENVEGVDCVKCCKCKAVSLITPRNTHHNPGMIQGCVKYFICPKCGKECCLESSKTNPKLTPAKNKQSSKNKTLKQ
ncbi:hypothetical protein [Candidatus Enterovibrio escicola]|uniref:hypothetical protein n=1 Tax=Candidatus Enterovibrio escicola TaxID=1927127 RepID=UPI001237A9ED|nr:hypothetical protein [Candidatus Enterovibrio escacola]